MFSSLGRSVEIGSIGGMTLSRSLSRLGLVSLFEMGDVVHARAVGDVMVMSATRKRVFVVCLMLNVPHRMC